MHISGSDFRLLQVFASVVRHGGFAAAEEELNVSQSTISNFELISARSRRKSEIAAGFMEAVRKAWKVA